MIPILVIFVLILINGIFSMAEIAMVASRKSRLETAAKKGDKAAKKALELSRNPGKFFSTVQIGITLIGILTGIYSGEKIEGDLENLFNGFEFLKAYSGTLAVATIVIILTFFSLVLGELVPKRLALFMPETITKVLSFPMFITSIIAAPFIWLLTVTTDLIIKLFKLKKPHDTRVTEDEIKAIIQDATDTGVIQEIEQDIVENVFHLSDRKINTLMTHRSNVVYINLNEDIDKTKSLIISSIHKSFPVCDGELDNIKGIVHSKEMLNLLLQNESLKIENLIKPALFLTEGTSAYRSLEKFNETKEHLALVVDEYGSVKGILTMKDIFDALVGDLAVQLHEKKEIIPRGDGTYLIDGSLPMPEFSRYFKINLTEDPSLAHVHTVGGLAFQTEKIIPYVGYKFQWKDISFEILDMDGRRVDKLLVKITTSH